MSDSGVTKRLSAILAADIAGYTRLMEADSDGTVAAWQAARSNVIDPSITGHAGRIVKHTGDGFLAEFATVQSAVECAVAIQDGLTSSSLEFRIGVNLGDIIDDGEDIHGEGVNIAARIEALADPGGICVSGMVHDSIRNRLDRLFEDIGEHQVKHVSAPVRVYRIAMDAAPPVNNVIENPALPDKPSIAVLPFDNMSGDPEQEYFSDGISEDIITDLSNISGLLVIARNSSFAYKGKSVDMRQFAAELGVAYVLEGSVRRADNNVRITAQLIEGISGAHLWAERYDRDLHDIFAIQDEITREVVSALKITLRLDETARIGVQATNNMEAYDLGLRGLNMLYRHDRGGVIAALKLFEQAIVLDPTYLMPYLRSVVALANIYINDWADDREEILKKGYELAVQAIKIDPMNPQGHCAMALVHTWKHDLDLAISEAERAMELTPNMAEAYAIYGNTQSYAGNASKAIDSLKTAMRLDPQCSDMWLHFLGHAYFIAADYPQAIEVLEQRIQRNPETDISRVLLASCCGHLGLIEVAQRAWSTALKINPEFSLAQKAKTLPYKKADDWARYVEGLRKAGIEQE
jgi:adenylate cyclase